MVGDVPGRIVADVMLRCPKVLRARSRAERARRLLEDPHVHSVPVVRGGVLVSVIERSDLGPAVNGHTRAALVGSTVGRVVVDTDELGPVWSRMVREGRRRLAVVDEDDALRGLLCLKRDGHGFCSDVDVANRRGVSTQRRDRGSRGEMLYWMLRHD